MFSTVLGYSAGCRNCRGLFDFKKTIFSEEEIETPSRSELLELLDYGQSEICPNCRSRGKFQILTITFNQIIHDLANAPSDGLIHITSDKISDNNYKALVTAGIGGMTKTDLINALKIVDNIIYKMMDQDDLMSQDDLNTHKINVTNKNFIFGIKLSSDPPYISEYITKVAGFTSRELYEIISELKNVIRKDT